jgi:hypothetical protein
MSDNKPKRTFLNQVYYHGENVRTLVFIVRQVATSVLFFAVATALIKVAIVL